MRHVFALTNHQLMSLGITSFSQEFGSEKEMTKVVLSYQRWVAGRLVWRYKHSEYT